MVEEVGDRPPSMAASTSTTACLPVGGSTQIVELLETVGLECTALGLKLLLVTTVFFRKGQVFYPSVFQS